MKSFIKDLTRQGRICKASRHMIDVLFPRTTSQQRAFATIKGHDLLSQEEQIAAFCKLNDLENLRWPNGDVWFRKNRV